MIREPLLTATEAAAHLRCSRRALYHLVRRYDRFPALRRGRALLFDRAELDAWMRDHTRVDPTVTTLATWKQRVS